MVGRVRPVMSQPRKQEIHVQGERVVLGGLLLYFDLQKVWRRVAVTQRGFPVDDCARDGRGALSERSEFANTVINRRTGGRRKRSVLQIPSTITFVNSNI